MERIKKVSALVLLGVTVSMLSATHSAAGGRNASAIPEPEQGQRIVPENESMGPGLMSEKTNAVFAGLESRTCSNNPRFTIVAVNGSESAWRLSPDDVTITVGYLQYNVLDADEYEKETKRKAAWATALGVTGAVALAGIDVQVARQTGVYKGDGALLAMRLGGMAKEATRLDVERFRQTVLKSASVAPGEQHGGMIVAGKTVFGTRYKRHKDDLILPLTLTVRAGNEIHVFHFRCDGQ